MIFERVSVLIFGTNASQIREKSAANSSRIALQSRDSSGSFGALRAPLPFSARQVVGNDREMRGSRRQLSNLGTLKRGYRLVQAGLQMPHLQAEGVIVCSHKLALCFVGQCAVSILQEIDHPGIAHCGRPEFRQPGFVLRLLLGRKLFCSVEVLG